MTQRPAAGPEAGWRALEAALAAPAGDHELPEPAAGLSAVTAPVLAVGGAHDIADFRDVAAEPASLIPGAAHVELSRAGHLPSLERPSETTELLLEFLRRHAQGG